MNIKQLIILALVSICMMNSSCEKLKLQKHAVYEASYYDNKLNMSVIDFMISRPDMFSGMLSAIDYVDADPNYKDVKEMYSKTGDTYLLLHNNALINLEDANSFFSRNMVLDQNPSSPTFGLMTRGTAWSQYSREVVANLLKYHVMKGTYSFSTLNSDPKWIDTYAISPTNDSAKVFIYLQATRDGYLLINNYVGTPAGNIRPRTPDLYATNGVIHVMNRFMAQPTRQAILNNKTGLN